MYGNSSQFNWKSLKNQADQVLGEDFWSDIAGLVPNHGPRIDVYQTSSEFVIVVELSGIKSPDEVKLKLNNTTLSIRGKISRGYPVTEDQIIQSERFFGQFERKISLPQTVSKDEVKAQYHNGLLEIRLAKLPDKEETDIDIEFGQV